MTTADDPARWLRRACASGPQVHQYIPGRFSALLASCPACRPDAKRHRDPCCAEHSESRRIVIQERSKGKPLIDRRTSPLEGRRGLVLAATRAAFFLAALFCVLTPGRGAAAEPRPFLATPDELTAALDTLEGADLVVLADPGRRPARLRLATRVAASVGHVRAMLVDLAAYRSALPALRRLEFEAADSRHATTGRTAEGMVVWELEVPLWNLEGKLWLQPTPTGANLIVMEGDFSPGLVRLSATPEPAGTTLLLIDASANLRDVNWITRRMVKRNPLAEPGLAAASFYVMLRALRLQAERVGDAQDGRRRPATAPSPPKLSELDGGRLSRLASAGFQVPALLAAVRSRENGRLALVQVLASSRLAAGVAAVLVAQPQTWQALPGWRKLSLAKPVGECSSVACWKLDTSFPFLDLDATWKIGTQPWRALSVAGACQGAAMGLDLFPIGTVTATVLSLYPRLDKAGYVPRKSIESEPLLEHGLSLGVALVDAITLVRALDANVR